MKACRRLIQQDMRRYNYIGNSVIGCYFTRPTFRYVFWLRIVQEAKRKRLLKFSLGIIAYAFLRHYEFKYGIHVNSNIRIGGGLNIAHGDGVYLNCVSIGENFTVFQSAVLGASMDKGIPMVEDNVTVYAGAKIFGDIVLKNGCAIAANAVVTHDVEANSVVAGVPAKKIRDAISKDNNN